MSSLISRMRRSSVRMFTMYFRVGPSHRRKKTAGAGGFSGVCSVSLQSNAARLPPKEIGLK
jgi:hypothetical protein